MGFSLGFYRIDGGELVDPDREGIAEFLRVRGLRVEHRSLVDDDGAVLAFDGAWSDLYLDPLDQDGPLSGGIDHATLTAAECEFIYGLCVAGRLMVVNPQGDPMYVVPARNHGDEALPDPEGTTWVDSPEELASALGAGFGEFQEYRCRVMSSYLSDWSEDQGGTVSGVGGW
ncbi:hypothetical protein ABI214_00550 [Prescottella soli]|uniref:SUKH-4 immunity protein of toxin-antitoxin system n=1 Tax=Prescottella soli TaxID=1543852 RepID=A0ABW9G038_9NOCA